jgi:periplasmic divalent cation tolerance protein
MRPFQRLAIDKNKRAINSASVTARSIMPILNQFSQVMYQIIFCTCPDQKTAKEIADQLIINHLAACVNIAPGITSVYQWQGKIESTQEQLLFIKSHSNQYQAIETKIKQIHPYELPEIIAVPIERGLPEYLQWINTCLSTK